MKIMLFTAMAVLIFSSHAFSDTALDIPTQTEYEAVEAGTWSPFERVRERQGVIEAQFPASGVRWLILLNETGTPRPAQYGEIIKLKRGEKLKLTERHARVWVEPVKRWGRYRLKIIYWFDARSFKLPPKHRTYEVPVISALSEPEAKKEGDVIDQLAERLDQTHGLWTNGMSPLITLPENTDVSKVIAEVMRRTNGQDGKKRPYKILKQKRVKIFSGGMDNYYWAALLRAEGGNKIVLLKYQGTDIGWWSRVFDAEQAREAPSKGGRA